MTRLNVILLLVCLFVPSVASAQAWIAEPGSGYVELGGRLVSGDQFYDSEGESQPLASTYTQTTLNFFAQTGVIERWLQLTAAGEIYRRNELENQGATSGPGDLQVGAWIGLLQDHHNVALGVRVGIPTGDPDPEVESDNPQVQIIAASLPTGDGEVDITPMLAYGTSFGGASWPLQHYLTASFGYQIRTEGFQDALEYRLELGTRLELSVLDRVCIKTAFSGLEPLGAVDGNGFSGLGSGVTYTAFSVGFAVDIWSGFGMSAAIEGAFRARRIIGAAPVSLALFYDF